MVSFSDQLRYVNSLDLETVRHRRQDCPWCAGKHTLSITKENGYLSWHCFRASCGVKGVQAVGRSVAELKQTLRHEATESQPSFELPAHLVPATANKECVRYMERNNCLDAYTRQDVDIRYDPKQHRAVFVVYHNNQPVDAVGRALDWRDKPKWYRYGKSGMPLTVGNDSLAVVVEDAASAAAISNVATGIALMGTSLMDSHLSHLREYSKVYIALDPDATRKAIDIHRFLSYYVRCWVIRLDEEFKNLTQEGIRERLFGPFVRS